MNSAMFNLLTRSFAILGILLLVGTFLRAKVPFFQRLYLPAAVIGGTIGMLIGPRALNIVPFFSDEYLTTWNTSVSFLCAIMAKSCRENAYIEHEAAFYHFDRSGSTDHDRICGFSCISKLISSVSDIWSGNVYRIFQWSCISCDPRQYRI